MQLQRTKSALSQSMEELKKQLEEECKVSQNFTTLDALVPYLFYQSIKISNHNYSIFAEERHET